LTLVSGITEGVPFFLVGSGLAFTLGVMDILNFAHGVFFMIGAYLLYQLLSGGSVNIWVLLLACVAAGALTGVVGVANERLILRTTYKREPLVAILATYGIFLGLTGVVSVVWGAGSRFQAPSNDMATVVTVGNLRIPESTFWFAGIALLVGAGLYLLITRTMFGVRVRAVAEDREMAGALGVRTQMISVVAFFIGTFLAGFAGALLAGQVSIDPTLGTTWVLFAFLVVVVGGLGSIPGSFFAAMILGIADALCATYVPDIEPYIFYIVVMVVLLIKPTGLMGVPRRASH
jgi:branched-subunit amino acid ABC-type transport system permease component